jgi:hypothetical protein
MEGNKMKRYKLIRTMQYNETTTIEAENWEAAKRALKSDIEFGEPEDLTIIDELIDYKGEVE